MRLSEYASTQRTYGSRKVPRSVQQSIPIDRIYEDGTWRCGNVYSQMWSMPDINFTMSDEDNKAKILNLLGKVYMGVPSDCWLKICIVSQRRTRSPSAKMFCCTATLTAWISGV